MADPILPSNDPLSTIGRLIAEIAASQQRQAAMLRDMAQSVIRTRANIERHHGMMSTPDCCDCEICGRQVAADQMDGFAARHGAVIHVNCLTAQMEGRTR